MSEIRGTGYHPFDPPSGEPALTPPAQPAVEPKPAPPKPEVPKPAVIRLIPDSDSFAYCSCFGFLSVLAICYTAYLVLTHGKP